MAVSRKRYSVAALYERRQNTENARQIAAVIDHRYRVMLPFQLTAARRIS